MLNNINKNSQEPYVFQLLLLERLVVSEYTFEVHKA